MSAVGNDNVAPATQSRVTRSISRKRKVEEDDEVESINEENPKKRVYKKCTHEEHPWRCRICHPEKFCTEHAKNKEKGILKTNCSQCNGSGICVHRVRKQYCKTCFPKNFCIEHGKYKWNCSDCEYGEKCEHGLKRNCTKCEGGRGCEHGNNKYVCLECKAEFTERESIAAASEAESVAAADR